MCVCRCELVSDVEFDKADIKIEFHRSLIIFLSTIRAMCVPQEAITFSFSHIRMEFYFLLVALQIALTGCDEMGLEEEKVIVASRLSFTVKAEMKFRDFRAKEGLGEEK